MPSLDRPPPDPYIRDPRAASRAWHIAVRVLGDGSVVLRCRIVPMPVPHQWRSDPPEISIDTVTCPLCLIV